MLHRLLLSSVFELWKFLFWAYWDFVFGFGETEGYFCPCFFIHLNYLFCRHPGLSSKQSSQSCFNAQKYFQKTYRTRIKFKQQGCHLRYHSQDQADYSDNIHSEEKEEDVSRATLIWRVIKLPIYSVALVPLTVSFFNILSALYLLFAFILLKSLSWTSQYLRMLPSKSMMALMYIRKETINQLKFL